MVVLVRPEFPWLTDIYRLVEEGKPDDAIDILFERFDEMHRYGEFTNSDHVITQIDLARLDTNVLVGLLSITWHARERLWRREDLVTRVEARLRELAPDRVERLMKGLR